MKLSTLLLTLSAAIACPAAAARADEAKPATAAPEAAAMPVEQAPTDGPDVPGVEFQKGPTLGLLGDQAGVSVPEGYVFTGSAGTKRLMEMMENPVGGNELGFLAPKDLSWFVVFEYDDTGYVKDDEKDKIDAEALLSSFKKGTEAGNKVRRERGWDTLEIVGWETPPAYNPTTHNLEWATRAKTGKGEVVVNHNIRLLGREGVMSAILVADPDQIVASADITRQMLTAGYQFNKGKTYAEFKKGDKIAEYGLMGLMTAGAGVVAVKSGLLGKLWKLIIIPIAAAGAWLKKLFSRNDTSTPA